MAIEFSRNSLDDSHQRYLPTSSPPPNLIQHSQQLPMGMTLRPKPPSSLNLSSVLIALICSVSSLLGLTMLLNAIPNKQIENSQQDLVATVESMIESQSRPSIICIFDCPESLDYQGIQPQQQQQKTIEYVDLDGMIQSSPLNRDGSFVSSSDMIGIDGVWISGQKISENQYQYFGR